MDRKRQTEQDKKALRHITKQERYDHRPGRNGPERCDRQNQVSKHTKAEKMVRRWREGLESYIEGSCLACSRLRFNSRYPL